MPIVPTYKEPQAREQALRPVSQSTPDVSSGTRALAAGLGQLGEGLDRLDLQRAQAEANEADTRITAEWLRWDGENRGKFRGQNVDGYAPAAEEWWKKAAGEASASLSPRAQALANRALASKRSTAIGNVLQFSAGERERHADESTAASITTDIEFALSSGNIASGATQVRERVAIMGARKGWTTEQVQAEATKSLTQLHGLHITRLLDTNPEAAKAHLLAATTAGEIDARARVNLEGAVEKAGTLSKAQKFADAVVQEGLPIDAALKRAETLDGEGERLAKAEIRQRYSDAEATKREALERHYGTALLELEQGGRVKPSTFAMLDPRRQADILNRQKAEAKARRAEAEGRSVKTDWNVYATLRETADTNPGEFARTDLRMYLDKIGPGQMEQLLDAQSRLRKPDTSKAEQTVSQRVNDFAGGLDMNTTKRAQFRSYVHDQVRAEQARQGRALDDRELTEIMDGALLRPPGWFQDRTFEDAFKGRKQAATRGTPAAAPAAPVLVKTPEEARTLTPGTRFQTPDGRTFTR